MVRKRSSSVVAAQTIRVRTRQALPRA